MNTAAQKLAEKIDSRTSSVCIIGLGYVGLPLAMAFSLAGFPVTGLDIDKHKIKHLYSRSSYFKHIPSDSIAEMMGSGHFLASTDFSLIAQQDVIIICLPTPLNEHREPDMSYVENAALTIGQHLQKGQLVVLESTTYPGTSSELIKPILEESGLRCGEDFFLAYSPEREDPGNPVYDTKSIPKVVGGFDPTSTELADQLYSRVVKKTVPVSSMETAEAVKLTENIFRSVNIALVNELKIIFERMGINVWEVIDAASTKPFGFMRFEPGPGWGGHCIPVDPFYLTWKAREFGLATRFIEIAGEINVTMPNWIVRQLTLQLNGRGKAVRGSKVLLLGIAYKRDIDDLRESPALVVMDLLLDLGAEVSFHDPYITELPSTRSHPDKRGMRSLPLTKDSLAEQDAVIVVTDHTDIDYPFVVEHTELVLDSRGVYHKRFPHLCDRVMNV